MSNNREYTDLGHALAMIKNGEMAHSTLEAAMAQCIESQRQEIELLTSESDRFRRALFGANGTLPLGDLSTSRGAKESEDAEA